VRQGAFVQRMLLAVTFLVAVASPSFGSDAYFVRFNAVGRPVGSGNISWVDDILFFNTNAASVSVRFVGASNGAVQANPPDLVLPPGRTVSLNANSIINGAWTPLPMPALWVLHLDVPAGVVAESRDEFYVSSGIPELFASSRGKVSMPIYRALVAANDRQVHLGTDLGNNDSRINVGIYNAGSNAATATIEVRRTCDDTVMTSSVVTVPPNSVIQAGGLGIGSSDQCPTGVTVPWERMVSVSVDQPSFTFISNVNENIQRVAGEAGAVPIVGLAVAINQRF